jgi:hypothetical protein
LEKIGIVHLYTLGYREDDLLSFKLKLNNPSKIAELQELEHWKQKFDIAGAATDGYFSKRWISENLLGMSEDEFLRNQREMFFDKKYSAKLEAATAGGEAAEDTGGTGGLAGGLGDLGGTTDTGGDTDDLGDLGGGETLTDTTGGDQGGDTDLLAEPPPAKREDDIIKPPTTKKGGITKAYKNQAVGETGTKRKTFPGAYGYGSLNTMESQMAYEEDKLFSVSREVEMLIESLNTKEKQDET